MSDMEETTQPLDLLNNSTTWVTIAEIIHEIVPATPGLSTLNVTLLSVIIGIIVFLTVFVNVLVVVAFCTTPKLRVYYNYFIFGLAIMDLLVGGVNMPIFAVVILSGRWLLGEIFCDIFTFMDHAFTHASILLVMMISFDRCIAVSYPIRHRLYWRRRSRAILMIAVSYIIPVIMWLPMTTFWSAIHGIEQRPFPEDVCLPLYGQSIYAGMLVLVLFGGIPFTITTILCARIHFVLRKFYRNRKKMRIAFGSADQVARNTKGNATQGLVSASSKVINETAQGNEIVLECNVSEIKDANPKERNSRAKCITKESTKGVRIMDFIVAAMWIAWLPSLIVTCTSPFCPYCVPDVVYSAAIFWGCMNSLLNPICYALADEAFKNAFLRILALRCLTSGRGAASLRSNKL